MALYFGHCNDQLLLISFSFWLLLHCFISQILIIDNLLLLFQWQDKFMIPCILWDGHNWQWCSNAWFRALFRNLFPQSLAWDGSEGDMLGSCMDSETNIFGATYFGYS